PMHSPRLPFISSCIDAPLPSFSGRHHPRKRVIQYSRGASDRIERHGVLDAPPSGGMTRTPDYASSRLKTSVALVPPKPNEFDSTVPSLALSMRLRTIGMSENAGSSSVMWALSQTKPLFIIKSE